jgi:hypothetical protein
MTQLSKLPVSTSGCINGTFSYHAGDVELSYEYLEHGSWWRCRISFSHVVTHRFVNEGHCAGFPESAYNAIALVPNSVWLQCLETPTLWPFERNHYAVYLRDIGCFELIAESFQEHLPLEIEPNEK